MAVSVEVLEGLQRKIILSLDWQAINTEVMARLRKTQKRVKLDGFRPGKAPMKMIQSMYGVQTQDEVLNEMAFTQFNSTVAEEKINALSLQKLDVLETQDDKEKLAISAVFEVYPEFVIGDLSGQEIEKVSTEVTSADVEKTINILRQQRTTYDYVEREAQEGDRVIVDFAGKIDGEAFAGGEGKNHPFIIGRGEMLPEFEQGVIGLKEGESKDVSVSFPEDYHGKEVAGKTAVFTIKVNNVAHAKLPELDEEFARSLGIVDGNIDSMKAEIEKNISREVKRRTEDMTKSSALKALLASTKIEVPTTLLNEESERLRNEMLENFKQQGLDVQQISSSLPLDMFTEKAKERVALGLILNQLVDENNLYATDEQVREVIEGFAESYEDPQEVIDWYLSSAENSKMPKALATEQNAVAYLLTKVKVIEKTMTFDEVMAQQA